MTNSKPCPQGLYQAMHHKGRTTHLLKERSLQPMRIEETGGITVLTFIRLTVMGEEKIM